jgi:anti-anti-sigma factor
MVFEEYTYGRYYVVKLRVDTSQPEEIEKVRDHLLALCDQGKRFLAIDLNETDYVGSGIINTLVKVNNQLISLGGSLAVITFQEKILEVFRIVNLEKVIPLYTTMEAFRQVAQA